MGDFPEEHISDKNLSVMGSISPDWLYRLAYVIPFALAVAFGTNAALHCFGIDFAPGLGIAALVGLVVVFVVLSYDRYQSSRDQSR